MTHSKKAFDREARFSEDVKKLAWVRACGGKFKRSTTCECKMHDHGHIGKCSVRVSWELRGRKGKGYWEAHHVERETDGGDDTKENCLILCGDCHSKTIGQGDNFPTGEKPSDAK